jgi:YVTN family beta-propeller protein
MSAPGWFLVGVALLAAVVQWAPPLAQARDETTVTVASLPIGAQVAGLAVGAGAVWVVDGRAGTVARLDPHTNQVVATIPVAAPSPTCERCWGTVAAGDGVVWVTTDAAGPVVVRIDPTANAIAETVQVGVLPVALAVDEDGGLWLTATLQDAVVHVDPHPAGAVARTAIHLPARISAGRDAVWASAWQPGANGQVMRLDPRTGWVLASIPVGREPGALAVDDADVWVANGMDDTVSRIDARTNTVVATLPVVHDPVGVVIGTDAVWVVSRGSALLAPPTLSRIDPSRNMVAETTPLEGAAPIGTAAGADSLWVASRNLNEVMRIGPVPLPASASAASDPPLLVVVLWVGTILVLAAGALARRSVQRGDRRVRDGRLLSALLLRQQASRRAGARDWTSEVG